jgi:hypothetical protein
MNDANPEAEKKPRISLRLYMVVYYNILLLVYINHVSYNLNRYGLISTAYISFSIIFSSRYLQYMKMTSIYSLLSVLRILFKKRLTACIINVKINF